ncbi:hypothetical protein UlMin_040818 [Ulmus minor]
MESRRNLLKLLLFLLLLSLLFFLFNSSFSASFIKSQSQQLYHHSHPITPLSIPALPFPKQALPTKSGYLPINPTSNSSIFYTFYEAQNPISPLPQTPLLVWLQGGPGCSSMYGSFLELGPWQLVNNNSTGSEPSLVLKPNPGSWNRIFGLLFLDNPIGSGFSIAAKSEEIPKNSHSVAQHLFIAINKFLEQNPSFRSRRLYIAGESYAGKYVPAIGYYIVKKNYQLWETRRINFGGIAIGNGLTDPITQVASHASNAYFTGLINTRQRAELEKLQDEAIRLVKLGKWREATEARYAVMESLRAMTGLATLFDFSKKAPYEIQMVTNFLQNKIVKKALKAKLFVGFDRCSEEVARALHDDTMKSVKYMVEFLVRKSKVLLYQGQFDLWDGVVSTEAWVKTMDWEEIDKFLMANRFVWKDEDGELIGYVQKWKNLSHVVVSRAGHLVPVDQPLNSQRMIENWVLDKGLFEDVSDQEQDFSLFD